MEKSVNIVLYVNIAFMVFYCVAIFWSFRAYKEFKGVVEDNVGADAMKEAESQNILAYGDLTNKKQKLPGSLGGGGYMPLSQNDNAGGSSGATTRANNVPGQNNINTLNHGATGAGSKMPPNPFSGLTGGGSASDAQSTRAGSSYGPASQA